MSQTETFSTEENRKIIYSLYEAIQHGDIATVKGLLDPDVVMHEAPSLPYGGVHRGIDAVVQVVGQVMAVLDISKVAVERIVADGDWVVVLADAPIVEKPDPASHRMPLAECWRLSNGKVVELRAFYWDTALLV